MSPCGAICRAPLRVREKAPRDRLSRHRAGNVKRLVSGRRGSEALVAVLVHEDGEQDALHGGAVLEDAHDSADELLPPRGQAEVVTSCRRDADPARLAPAGRGSPPASDTNFRTSPFKIGVDNPAHRCYTNNLVELKRDILQVYITVTRNVQTGVPIGVEYSAKWCAVSMPEKVLTWCGGWQVADGVDAGQTLMFVFRPATSTQQPTQHRRCRHPLEVGRTAHHAVVAA